MFGRGPNEKDRVDQLHAACPDRIDGYLHMGDQTTLDGVVEHRYVGLRSAPEACNMLMTGCTTGKTVVAVSQGSGVPTKTLAGALQGGDV